MKISFDLRKIVIQALLGWVVGFSIAFSLGSLTSIYFVRGLLHSGAWNLIGPMREFSMFLNLAIRHDSVNAHFFASQSLWILYLTLICIVCGAIALLAQPYFQRRYFIASVFGAAFSWFYFAYICEQYFNRTPNPNPWGVKLFFMPQYFLAREDWYWHELHHLLLRHLEIFFIPLGLVVLVNIFDAIKLRKTENLNAVGAPLPKKQFFSIILIALIFLSFASCILLGIGSPSNQRYIVIATHEIPPGKILTSDDLALFDSTEKIANCFHSLDSVIGRKTKRPKIDCGSIIQETDLVPLE